MNLLFKAEKETKNTIRFTEVAESENDKKVGVIYIPKNTLAEIKWVDGKNIVLSLKTE